MDFDRSLEIHKPQTEIPAIDNKGTRRREAGLMRNVSKRVVFFWLALLLLLTFTACGKKCAIEGCENKPLKAKEYCEIHTCSVDECYQAVVAGGKVCTDHVCTARNCLLVKAEGSEYCEQHTCLMLGCYELVLDGSKYCREHTCAVEGCFERVKTNSTRCKDHSCAYDGCPDEPIEGEKYCTKHTCSVEGCLNQVAPAKPYCLEHECGKAACKNPHVSGGRYCEEHTCAAEGCLNRVAHAKPYCLEHECREAACVNPHISGGEYCTEHTCKKQGCFAEKVISNMDDYCSKHHAEMAKKERQAALAKLRKKYDKVEGITWYKPQNYPYYSNSRSYVLPYIGVRDSGYAWLRLVFHYTGDDWIFFEKITVSVDGQNYTKVFNYFEVTRNNGGGDVWEYVDITPSSADIQMLKNIAASKETIVRFQGENYHYDLTIKSADKTAITSVLNAYNLM